jgi:hypothetical protein
MADKTKVKLKTTFDADKAADDARARVLKDPKAAATLKMLTEMRQDATKVRGELAVAVGRVLASYSEGRSEDKHGQAMLLSQKTLRSAIMALVEIATALNYTDTDAASCATVTSLATVVPVFGTNAVAEVLGLVAKGITEVDKEKPPPVAVPPK